MGRKKLVQKEEVLSVVRNWIVHNGVPPTIEELQKKLGVGSSRTVLRYLRQLEESGDITRWGGARGIRLRRSPDDGVETVPVPLVGNVTAGALSFAEEYIEGWIRVPTSFTRPKSAEFFLLRVSGDSMNKAQVGGYHIEDGDFVLVRQQQVANPGDIVLALVDGQTTIKRLKRGIGYCILQPESTNMRHQPIVVEDDFYVQGVVCHVFKGAAGILENE